MSQTRNYVVTWKIDIEATSAPVACEEALQTLDDPTHIATIFECEGSVFDIRRDGPNYAYEACEVAEAVSDVNFSDEDSKPAGVWTTFWDLPSGTRFEVYETQDQQLEEFREDCEEILIGRLDITHEEIREAIESGEIYDILMDHECYYYSDFVEVQRAKG